jgi:hypothetical protein
MKVLSIPGLQYARDSTIRDEQYVASGTHPTVSSKGLESGAVRVVLCCVVVLLPSFRKPNIGTSPIPLAMQRKSPTIILWKVDVRTQSPNDGETGHNPNLSLSL